MYILLCRLRFTLIHFIILFIIFFIVVILSGNYDILRLLTSMLIILLLLEGRERLILHLKLHRKIDILPLTEPQDQIIAFLQTFPHHASLMIQLRQFIRPLFNIFCLLKFFKSCNLLLKRRLLHLQNPVFQDILVRILRCQLNKLFITIRSFLRIINLKRQSCKPIDNLPAPWRTVKCHQQNITALLKFSTVFISFTDSI